MRDIVDALQEYWHCTPGPEDTEYGRICDSMAHNYAMWTPEGCEFAIDTARVVMESVGEDW